MDKFFKISERGSNVKTEIIAGLTTFFAMSYIVVTNPNQIVSFMANGTGKGPLDTIWLSTYVASILVAIIGTLLYALYAKLPYAQACGMGLNSFFFVAFILPNLANPMKGYREGLCVILLSGIIFLILSITGARQYIAKALPENLKKAIPAGIGLFIAFIGFKNVGIIQANQYTFVQLFDFHGVFAAEGKTLLEMSLDGTSGAIIGAYESLLNYDYTHVITGMDAWRVTAPVVLAIVGLLLMAFLSKKGSKVAVIGSIGIVSVLYYLTTWQLPSFDLGSIGASFKAFGTEGLLGAFRGFTIFEGGASAILNAIVLVITFCLVDMFDTIGTLYGTASQADLLDENGDPIELDKAMACDSVATVTGAVLGTSTCTTFVESAAGVGAGGRTGLASLVTSACFFLCLFLTPLALIIPACATAPALIYVGVLMLKGFSKVDMEDITAAVPAFLALIMMPLTYSISNGIAVGCIAHTILAAATGKYTKKDIAVTAIGILFALRFALVSM